MPRAIPALPLLLGALTAAPALAQDSEPLPAGEEQASGAAWSLSLDAGISGTRGDFEQRSFSAGLSRYSGDGYLSLALVRLADDGIAGSVIAVPTKTDQVSLGGGYAFGALSLDLSASHGWRSFDTARLRRRNGNVLTATGSGRNWALGGSASYALRLGERTTLTPSLSLDYDRSQTGRLVQPLIGPPFLFRQRQSGVTGGASVSLTHGLGEERQHSIGVNLGALTTSNAAATSGSVTGRRGTTRNFRPRVGAASKETWAELGGNASFALNEVVSLSLSAVRTLGMTGPESTSLTAGIAFGF